MPEPTAPGSVFEASPLNVVECAATMLMTAMRTRVVPSLVFAALFAVIALLLNPVLPAFALSANGLILLASMLPFVASLLWMKRTIQPAVVPSRS